MKSENMFDEGIKMKKNSVYGLLKTKIDAHTLGVKATAGLLEDCGYKVLIANERVQKAMEQIDSEEAQTIILEWIKENKINRLGFSYRLDPKMAIYIMGKLVYILKENMYLSYSGGSIDRIFFAGLPEACTQIEKNSEGLVKTFKGGETAKESLMKMGVDESEIPDSLKEGSKYDEDLMSFARDFIKKGDYISFKPIERKNYAEFGTYKDTIEKRVEANCSIRYPLIRAHVGPFSVEKSRRESIDEFIQWCKTLARDGFLDILSIGTSQLSQSNFGENWDNMQNGGGVPINSIEEFNEVWSASRPLLLRTYSGTKNIKNMAAIYEKSINICWHALSLWWFNQLDGRGPNDLYTNLKEHIDTIKYIASTGKAFEANVSHHFSFRGADDVTYVASAYLAAKLAKRLGIKTFILQNMLNTPRATWGVQDLAKSRVMLELIKTLEDETFNVIYQPRAGLDYFKPDIEEAKVQLAAVTALMDDVDPYNQLSPQIIHVVSYSEGLFLATPNIINDSIKITQCALEEYRRLKKSGMIADMGKDYEVQKRYEKLKNSTIKLINAMESNIENLYSPEGFYIAFVAGWLPVPDLWNDSDEFVYAKDYESKTVHGECRLFKNKKIISTDEVIKNAINHIGDAIYILNNK